MPKPQQESSVLGCAWLAIHCLLIWCIQLPDALPLGAYSATAIICQPSRFFLWCCLNHLRQHCHNRCRYPSVEILGQSNVTFLLLPSTQFTLLLFPFFLLYPVVLHSLFQLLLQSLPCWFPSSIDQLSIYPDFAFLKLDLHSNVLHCLHFFFYYRILLFGVLSSPCSAGPLVFWAGYIASDSQPRLFVDVFQRIYSSSTILVQSLIAWLLPKHIFDLNSRIFTWPSSMSGSVKKWKIMFID